METETIEQDADTMLSEGIASLIAGSEDSSSSQDDNTTSKDSSQSDDSQVRGTADDKGTNNGEKASNDADSEQVNASTTTPADSKEGQSKPEPKKGSAEYRIRELNNKANQEAKARQEAEAKLAEYEKKQKASTPPEPRVIIQPPAKPKYSIDQLKNLKAQAIAEGDQKLLEAVSEEIEAWRTYEVKQAAWEVRNGEAVRQYENTINHYRNQAITKWPELKNSDSPIFKTFSNIVATFPEVLNRADGRGEYFAAELASILIRDKEHETVVGALKKENETLKAENNKLKGKLNPAKSRGTEQTGDPSEDDPDVDFSNKLRALKS